MVRVLICDGRMARKIQHRIMPMAVIAMKRDSVCAEKMWSAEQ